MSSFTFFVSLHSADDNYDFTFKAPLHQENEKTKK